jgi:8-oxo-dGTP pyrophosphatase MutT (NUDIX family)
MSLAFRNDARSPAEAANVLGVSRPVPPDRARRALRDALLRHVPADAAEADDLKEILALVELEPACFSRRTFTPGHITGSAFVVCRSMGKVLLHHHRRLNAWLQLGGHDDGEDDPRATALREAAEESGLKDLTLLSDEILDLDIHTIPAGKGEPPHLHHDVRFAVATRAPEAIQRDAGESVDLRWFTLDEAAERMNESGGRRALSRLSRLLANLPF